MIIGHNRITEYLSRAVASDDLSHAYLFSGPESVGKMTAALEFAKFLQCSDRGRQKNVFDYCDACKDCYDIDQNSHPDFYSIVPDGKEIKISQIRDLTKGFSLKNYAASYKIAIIDEAEKMTIQAANALLKTLEEPGKNSILILVSSYVESMLPTIISRCQGVKFSPVSYRDLETGLLKSCGSSGTLSDVPDIAKLSSGRPGVAIKTINETGFKEKREKNYREFAQVATSPLFARNQYVASALLKDDVEGILSVWLDVLKDLSCLYFDGGERFMQNNKLKKDFNEVCNKYSLSKIISLSNKIKESLFLLKTTNVNKKLALEVLMLEL